MYFSFTTLSTVGFGDLHPQSSPERAAAVLVMLFCTAIFSLIIGEFMIVVDKYKLLDEEIGDGDKLTLFFNVLTKYNNNKQIDKKMKE